MALDGKGSFGRFKRVLARYPEERERWFEFSDRRLRARMVLGVESRNPVAACLMPIRKLAPSPGW